MEFLGVPNVVLRFDRCPFGGTMKLWSSAVGTTIGRAESPTYIASDI